MKKTVTILLLALHAVLVFSQVGFTPNFFGDFYKRDLTNPTNATLIGTTQNQLGASDFGADGVLYAISGVDNGLYKLDTTDASATLLATVPPTGSEFWTGMACDPTNGTMYVCSTDGNNSSLFTLNTETGETALIGTGAVEDGLVGIAFDNTGQMYGIYLVRKFYSIDKTNGQATYIGDFNEAVTAFPHHGLDFDPQTETMFMTSYNAFTFDNELWSVDLSTGANTLIGSVGVWTGTIAVRPPAVLAAAFSAEATEICAGESVAFMDESTGSPESWLWTFEGGDPATSTDQNPVVAYNTEGLYDVTLEITNGSGTNSITMTDFITVFWVPSPEVQGPDNVCTGHTESYSTENTGGTDFEWEVTGGDIVSGAGSSEVLVQWGDAGEGTVMVTENTPNCEVTSEIFEVLIDPCTAVEEVMADEKRIFPNPAREKIIVDLSDLNAKELKIFNSNGQIVYRSDLINYGTEAQVDITGLLPGIYFIRISALDGNSTSLKFSKVR